MDYAVRSRRKVAGFRSCINWNSSQGQEYSEKMCDGGQRRYRSASVNGIQICIKYTSTGVRN